MRVGLPEEVDADGGTHWRRVSLHKVSTTWLPAAAKMVVCERVAVEELDGAVDLIGDEEERREEKTCSGIRAHEDNRPK